MKKLPITLALIFLTVAAMAQHAERLTMKKVSQKKIPTAVISSFERDYPDMASSETTWYVVPFAAYKNEWAVRTNQDSYFDDHAPDHYSVALKGKDIKEQFVYDADGNLVFSKEVLKNTKLPRSIQESLANGFYKDWEVTGDKEVIKDRKTNSNEYKVMVEKKTNQTNEKQTLIFDENGKLLHTSPIQYHS